jgi:hypothetical protein
MYKESRKSQTVTYSDYGAHNLKLLTHTLEQSGRYLV